jgi:hypothetical protein
MHMACTDLSHDLPNPRWAIELSLVLVLQVGPWQ